MRCCFLIFAASICYPSVSRSQEAKSPAIPPYSADLVKEILADAKARGNARRGAEVFRLPTLACLSCHQVGGQGGTVGPDLSSVGKCLPPHDIVESVLWPKRLVNLDLSHSLV